MFTYRSTFLKQNKQTLLLMLVMVAFLLRTYHLDEQSIWFDESLSALFARQPLKIAIESMLQEGLHHSPLYYILLRPLVGGEFHEFSLRFLSVGLGVLAVPLLARLGQTLANAQVGLLAATLLVINPFHLWYSQEARMYTLLMLVAIGSMLFFCRGLKLGGYQNWLALAGFTALGINSHHFAFFIPLIQFVFILVTFKRNYRFLRPWVAAQTLAALSFVPWLLIVLDWGQFYLSSASRVAPTAYDLGQTFWNFSLGYTGEMTLWALCALSLFGLLFSLGLKFAQDGASGSLLAVWFFLPILFTFFVSLRLPTYLDRYLSVSLPPFLLLVAMGLCSLRSYIWKRVLFALVITAMLVGVYRVYYDKTVYDRADWRGVGAYLSQNASAGDVVGLLYYQYLVPLSFYYDGSAPLEPIVVFNEVNFPVLSETTQKLWLVIDHPNHSAHTVGHCQPFDEKKLSRPKVKNWRAENQKRLQQIKEFTCIRVEIYH